MSRPRGVEPGWRAGAHVTQLGLERFAADTEVLGYLLPVNVDADHVASPQAASTLRRTLPPANRACLMTGRLQVEFKALFRI